MVVHSTYSILSHYPLIQSLVINVEYNQLGPLLSSQGDCKGDVPDPTTGYSPYPGNANNLVIELEAYAKTLNGEDQGVVVEFVNPKYKDEKLRTEFKKPTRLECMMQDIPKLFQKEMGSEANIGFTMFDRWFTFSPAKVRVYLEILANHVSNLDCMKNSLCAHIPNQWNIELVGCRCRRC